MQKATDQELSDAVERGRKADLLMGDPTMQAAFSAIRQELLEGLASAPVRDTEAFQLLQAQVKVIDKVGTRLRDWIAGGDMAARDLEERIKRNEQERVQLENEREGFAARGMMRLRQIAGR
jgi:hypothetical protein